MRVLVIGSTSWTDRDYMRSVLAEFPVETVFVTGDTDGVDALTVEIGVHLGFRVDAMRKSANDSVQYSGEPWKGLNARMIVAGIDLVIAFHPDLGKPGKARGTQHLIDLATAAGIPVQIHPPRLSMLK